MSPDEVLALLQLVARQQLTINQLLEQTTAMQQALDEATAAVQSEAQPPAEPAHSDT